MNNFEIFESCLSQNRKVTFIIILLISGIGCAARGLIEKFVPDEHCLQIFNYWHYSFIGLTVSFSLIFLHWKNFKSINLFYILTPKDSSPFKFACIAMLTDFLLTIIFLYFLKEILLTSIFTLTSVLVSCVEIEKKSLKISKKESFYFSLICWLAILILKICQIETETKMYIQYLTILGVVVMGFGFEFGQRSVQAAIGKSNSASIGICLAISKVLIGLLSSMIAHQSKLSSLPECDYTSIGSILTWCSALLLSLVLFMQVFLLKHY
jgi:hypothetical protein